MGNTSVFSNTGIVDGWGSCIVFAASVRGCMCESEVDSRDGNADKDGA